ncbi:MAG: hypothetical protein KatS3mg015_2999 [Fimbriimonadales bacterium]|nr:MAG: hypothetical protein KatS3mg015_2999 [Fimbriimonadales bacterium]
MGTPSAQQRFVLMLSSGQRPRYRDDIIKALALPMGGRLQFRYRKEHVPTDAFQILAENKLRGAEALVAYLDASNQQAEPEIVPCRFAKILETEVVGEFCVIRFEVSEFASVTPAVDVRAQVSQVLPPRTTLPEWSNGQLEGHFLLICENRPNDCKGTREPQAWQALVAKLGGRQDFRSCPFFYYLRGVTEEGGRELVIEEGKYVLGPGRMHRAEVVHYTPDPKAGGVLGALDVRVEGPGVQGVTRQTFRIDSPYDVKQVHFRTVGENQKQYGLLIFRRVLPSEDSNRQSEHHDFELVLEVKGLWARQLVVGVLIALFLAAPRLADLVGQGPWVTALVSVLGAVVTAGLVVFGLRKVP